MSSNDGSGMGVEVGGVYSNVDRGESGEGYSCLLKAFILSEGRCVPSLEYVPYSSRKEESKRSTLSVLNPYRTSKQLRVW